MSVAFCSAGLTMPEHLADDGDRGEDVPKVVKLDIGKPGRPPDALPGLLNADEISVTEFAWKNVGASFLAATRLAQPDRRGFDPALPIPPISRERPRNLATEIAIELGSTRWDGPV
jgi:hypothetical protein